MKKIIILNLILGAIFLYSCKLDNYSVPDMILDGSVVDKVTGENIQTRQPDGIKIRLLKYLFFVLTFMLIAFHGHSQNKDLFRNENATEHDRIQNLLSVLTINEKIGLLRATSPEIPRLGIAKYYHGNEALHGIVRPGNFTVFPQAIGLASMWNPALHFKIATVISDEARARWNELSQGKKQVNQFSDLLTFWSPTVNMARDPRWGRTPETYGEDPFLSGVLGVQFVKGLQGNNPKYLKVVATPKHFAANNEEHNRFECNPQISERILRADGL